MFCKLQKVHNSRTIVYLPITDNVFSYFTLSKAQINLELIIVIPDLSKGSKVLHFVWCLFNLFTKLFANDENVGDRADCNANFCLCVKKIRILGKNQNDQILRSF